MAPLSGLDRQPAPRAHSAPAPRHSILRWELRDVPSDRFGDNRDVQRTLESAVYDRLSRPRSIRHKASYAMPATHSQTPNVELRNTVVETLKSAARTFPSAALAPPGQRSGVCVLGLCGAIRRRARRALRHTPRTRTYPQRQIKVSFSLRHYGTFPVGFGRSMVPIVLATVHVGFPAHFPSYTRASYTLSQPCSNASCRTINRNCSPHAARAHVGRAESRSNLSTGKKHAAPASASNRQLHSDSAILSVERANFSKRFCDTKPKTPGKELSRPLEIYVFQKQRLDSRRLVASSAAAHCVTGQQAAACE